jgi:hypothetical protein
VLTILYRVSKHGVSLEFEDTWLEVRPCEGGKAAASMDSRILEAPALSEVLEEAAKTNAKYSSGMWDYSRRLVAGEIGQIKRAVEFNSKSEDAKSVLLSANVTYRGSCYTLTLFAIKISQ